MGAIIVSIFVSVVACVGGIYGANRCGGNAAPYTPFYPPALISKTHS